MSQTDQLLPFRDPDLPLEQRIDDLVARMTVEEKCGQLLYEAPAVERLGIPAYNWWSECLHGVARNGRATVFPQIIGLAASFDPDLAERVATAISDEARIRYHAVLAEHGDTARYQGLTFWTPNINIFRDPRWGRGQETWGECPQLTGSLAGAFVRGLQGDDPRHLKVAACAKHFAVHSGPEKDRHGFDARVDAKDLYETYLPAFETLVRDGVEAVMGAYNRTNGEPCCGSQTLLVDILRGAWDFQGHVVSDCWAIKDFHEHHGVTSSPGESLALALRMGCDLNCGCVYEGLYDAYFEQRIDQTDIDRALRRLLRTRFKLGCFDPDERVRWTALPAERLCSPEHRALARRTAVQGITLLRNDGVLPIDPRSRKVLVVGQGAASVETLVGNYNGLNERLVTVLEGIVGRAPTGMAVEYKTGYVPTAGARTEGNYALYESGHADVVIAVAGLDPTMENEEADAIMSDREGDRERIELPEHQRAWLSGALDRGARLVLLVAGGTAIALGDIAERAAAVLWIGYPGEEGGNAVADILFGDAEPGGRLPQTWPQRTEDLPPFDDYAMTGRTYRYATAEALFPFGFGLGYTTWALQDLQVTEPDLPPGSDQEIGLQLRNTGSRDGSTVVQVYVHPEETAVRVPIWQLAAYRRVQLTADSDERIRLRIPAAACTVVQEDGSRVPHTGPMRVAVGLALPGARSEALGAPPALTTTFRCM